MSGARQAPLPFTAPQSDEAVGEYVTQWCCLCERPIPHRDTLWPDGGVQSMGFGQHAHRTCYLERYQGIAERLGWAVTEREEQAELWTA